MKLLYFFPLIWLFICSNVLFAQVPAEKVYVQTDRSFYTGGETVYFKAFVLSQREQVESTNLFAELFDTAMNRLAAVCLPVIDATAIGSLTIPKEIKNAPVFFRAYTDISLWQNEPFQFIRPLFRNAAPGKKKQDITVTAVPVFFPEGGKLVTNAENFIAFRSSAGFEGVIKNSKGVQITSVKTLSDDRGFFRLRPEEGESYFCHWIADGREQVKPLPVPVKEGIALHAYQQEDILYFDLDNGGNTNTAMLKPKVQLLIDGEVAFQVIINMTNFDKFSHSIPLREFKPGLTVLRVLDSSDNVVAKRNVFIIKKIADNNIQATIVKRDTAKRAENILTVNFPDTLLRYVSVSITDAAFNQSTTGTGLESVLLPENFLPIPDKQGNGNQPDLFDLAILTMGELTASTNSNSATGIQPLPRHLQLSGIARRGKKLVAGKEILLGIRSEYTGKELYKLMTDDQGRFVLEGLIIYGESFVHCRLPKTNEELECEISLNVPVHNYDNNLLNDFRVKALSMLPEKTDDNVTAGNAENHLPYTDTLIFSGKIIELEEAIVKSNPQLVMRKRLEELEKKYIDGTAFSGYFATGETLDVMNDPQTMRALDLFTYIGSKMRSVSLQYVRGRRQLFYFGRGSGGQTMVTVFYLNNSRVERDILDGIRLDEVAVIKFIPMLGSERGMPPALAIFLKKPGDQGYWETDRYQLSEQKIYGYPVTKEYLAPDYNNPENNVQTDHRKTLLWQPYAVVDKGKAEIKFFNNDFPGKIRIRVEGIAENGSIIFYEKLLE